MLLTRLLMIIYLTGAFESFYTFIIYCAVFVLVQRLRHVFPQHSDGERESGVDRGDSSHISSSFLDQCWGVCCLLYSHSRGKLIECVCEKQHFRAVSWPVIGNPLLVVEVGEWSVCVCFYAYHLHTPVAYCSVVRAFLSFFLSAG